MTAHEHSHEKPAGSARLWFALFGSAVLWFAAQTITYFVVPWSCSHANSLPLHFITLLALAGISWAGATGYRIWRNEGARWSDDLPDRSERSRFLAELAIGFSALFALLLIGMWVAIVVLGPCIPLPRVPFTPDALAAPAELLLAHPGAPLQPHDLWTAWSTDPAIWLGLIWAGVLYGGGLRYAPRRMRRRAVAFTAGCAVLAVALLSPLHALSEALFSAHMVQHTLIIAVAAPLIVMGRPVLISLWALPRRARRGLAAHRVSRTLAQATQLGPGQAFLWHGGVLWVWHLPALYQASLGNAFVHALQHASFLITALWFWSALFSVRRRSWSYGSGVFYTFATAVHTGALGALMTLAPANWYARYDGTTEAWGLTPLEDQQLAGLIMWVPAGLIYTLLALLLLAAWLRESEQRLAQRRGIATALLAGLLVVSGCDRASGTVREALDARTAAGLTTGSPTEGKRYIRRFGCGGCHEIEGIRGANGLVGPPLSGIGRRLYIAGVLTNTPENMARWIHDPPAVDSLTVMPKVGVTMDQARHIAAYLYTLR